MKLRIPFSKISHAKRHPCSKECAIMTRHHSVIVTSSCREQPGTFALISTRRRGSPLPLEIPALNVLNAMWMTVEFEIWMCTTHWNTYESWYLRQNTVVAIRAIHTRHAHKFCSLFFGRQYLTDVRTSRAFAAYSQYDVCIALPIVHWWRCVPAKV